MSEYRFHIENSYTPETLPMDRLAEYMAAYARLSGETTNVHFQGVETGSARLVPAVDEPAQAKVLGSGAQHSAGEVAQGCPQGV